MKRQVKYTTRNLIAMFSCNRCLFPLSLEIEMAEKQEFLRLGSTLGRHWKQATLSPSIYEQIY